METRPVFTTKFVIENNSDIIYVSHDADGDWQFFSKEEAYEKDVRVVSLNEILEIDASVNKILCLPEGTEAWRSKKGDKWTAKVNP